MNVIKINNLTKDYGNNKGIFDVTLNIEKGEVFGFLGPNGAGKTTTIRNLMGFIKPDSGKCKINNLDCFIDAPLIQKNVGYIPGEIAFMNDMKAMEFIKFMANYIGLKDLSKAYELIKLFELDTKIKIKRMSKGNKQKIGIVVALMHDPDILILDEPTSGLDPLMQNRFIELIKNEKKKGKTILMSSHIFEEIERTCSRVAIIKNGKIVTVENISTLKGAKSKKYTLTFNKKNDIENFKKESFEISNINDDKVTIVIKNNFKDFIKVFNKYDIVDLDEEYQNLEDIFLAYYGGDNND